MTACLRCQGLEAELAERDERIHRLQTERDDAYIRVTRLLDWITEQGLAAKDARAAVRELEAKDAER